RPVGDRGRATGATVAGPLARGASRPAAPVPRPRRRATAPAALDPALPPGVRPRCWSRGGGVAAGGAGGRLFRSAADGAGFPPLSRLHGDGVGAGAGRTGAGDRVAILQAGPPVAALGMAGTGEDLAMTTAALVAAVLMQAAPAPDLSWIAGYWLDCSGGREV